AEQPSIGWMTERRQTLESRVRQKALEPGHHAYKARSESRVRQASGLIEQIQRVQQRVPARLICHKGAGRSPPPQGEGIPQLGKPAFQLAVQVLHLEAQTCLGPGRLLEGVYYRSSPDGRRLIRNCLLGKAGHFRT
ncbi:hypothetical protein, partial [Hyalangium sp.]|uniref:hypothetical protein n=1 Tax=Hyalangium sp. TaxID=2028555 RepID=UPI002D660DED